MKRVDIIVRGRVQGVFYRATVSDIAEELGLKGFARNLPDGSVEIIAEGPDAVIDEFCERVQIKDRAINVEGAEVKFSQAKGEFSSFEIRR